MNIDALQEKFGEWHVRNFPTSELATYLGLFEEAGELARIPTKRAQGIRGYDDSKVAHEEIRKEVGDIFIKLMDIANQENFSLEQAIIDRWNTIKQRDWQRDKIGHGLAK